MLSYAPSLRRSERLKKAITSAPIASAAAAFLATPELRSRLFNVVDRTTLTVLARCAKVLTYDVAQILYREVDFGMARSMSRQTVR